MKNLGILLILLSLAPSSVTVSAQQTDSRAKKIETRIEKLKLQRIEAENKYNESLIAEKEVNLYLGIALENQGKFTEALDAYLEGLKLQPRKENQRRFDLDARLNLVASRVMVDLTDGRAGHFSRMALIAALKSRDKDLVLPIAKRHAQMIDPAKNCTRCLPNFQILEDFKETKYFLENYSKDFKYARERLLRQLEKE